jgi:hypothetical protein
MRKIPQENEVDIARGVLLGESYVEVGLRNGVVKSTVNRVVEEVRKVMPDFDEIRNTTVRFRRSEMSLADVERALSLKEKLDRLGLRFDDVETEVDALEKTETAQRFASNAVESLSKQNRMLSGINQGLTERNGAMQCLDEALTTRSTNIICRTCNLPFKVMLGTPEYYRQLISSGYLVWFKCSNCGDERQYSPTEILADFALCLLQRQRPYYVTLDLDSNEP